MKHIKSNCTKLAMGSLLGLGALVASQKSLAVVSHSEADKKAIEFCAKHSGVDKPAVWAQKMAQWGLSANIVSFAKDMFGDKFGLYVKSRHEAKASSKEGLYVRKDKYGIGTHLIPWSEPLSEGEDYEFSAGLSLNHDIEVIYIRYFADPCLAELMPPYVDEEFPSDIESFDKLNINDVVVYRSPNRISIGTQLLSDLGVEVPVGAGYTAQGQFQITIHKIDKTRMHLNISGLVDKSFGVGSEYSGGNALKFTGINFIDKQLQRLLGWKPWDISFAKGESQLFGADYELDLSSPEVASAFKKTIESYKLNVKNLVKNNVAPWGSIKEYSTDAVEKIKDIEDQYLEEKKKVEQAQQKGQQYQPKVQRHVRGRLTDDYIRGGGRVGNKYLALGSISMGCSAGKFTVLNENEAKEYYRLDSCRHENSISMLREWISEQRKKEMLLISKSENTFKTIDGLNLVFNDTIQEDKRFTKYDYADFRHDLQMTLPDFVYAQIPFDQKWQQGGEIVNNVYAHMSVVLKPDVIYNLPQMTKEQIKDSFKSYMNKFPVEYLLPVRDANKGEYNGNVEEYSYGDQLELISKYLAVALKNDSASEQNKILTLPTRVIALKEIVTVPLFEKIGLGYLLSLIPESEFNKNVNVFVVMNSTEATEDNKKYKMNFELPNSQVQLSPVYIKVQTLTETVNNKGEVMMGQSESKAFDSKDEIRKKEQNLMRAALGQPLIP